MDTIRFAVVEAPNDAGGGFQVLVFLNEVEVTSRGAGLGMDPYHLLIPTNHLLPTDPPSKVGVARCRCGVYGCGATDALIAHDGDVIRWEWHGQGPMRRPVTFDARRYLAAAEGVAGDHSWETPERTAGRLIITGVGSGLPEAFTLAWQGDDWRDPSTFQVCLMLAEQYQVRIDFTWRDRDPQILAAEVIQVLTSTPPQTWRAEWHAVRRGLPAPSLAGPHWSPWRV